MKHHNRPFLIAITGGIASGKTIACRELEDLGLRVYYTDKIAHKVLDQQDIKAKIINKFAELELVKEGNLDRKLLGEMVFNDPEKLKYLNALIHPHVKTEIQDIIEQSEEKIIIFEIPLLVESNLQAAFDLTINLHTPKSLQIERLMQNRKMSREKAEKIINSQIESDIRIKKTDLTIDNLGKISDLRYHIKKLVAELPQFPFKKVIKITEV